jgi:hypothetical protein
MVNDAPSLRKTSAVPLLAGDRRKPVGKRTGRRAQFVDDARWGLTVGLVVDRRRVLVPYSNLQCAGIIGDLRHFGPLVRDFEARGVGVPRWHFWTARPTSRARGLSADLALFAMAWWSEYLSRSQQCVDRYRGSSWRDMVGEAVTFTDRSHRAH